MTSGLSLPWSKSGKSAASLEKLLRTWGKIGMDFYFLFFKFFFYIQKTMLLVFTKCNRQKQTFTLLVFITYVRLLRHLSFVLVSDESGSTFFSLLFFCYLVKCQILTAVNLYKLCKASQLLIATFRAVMLNSSNIILSSSPLCQGLSLLHKLNISQLFVFYLWCWSFFCEQWWSKRAEVIKEVIIIKLDVS